jgi:hypothetical protein
MQLHDRAEMSPRQARVYRTWRATHHGKQRYPTKRRAWLAVARFWILGRHPDWQLHPYECRWGPDWRHGAVYPPHLHIGHGRNVRSLPRRIWYWWHRLVVWPAFRVRSGYRQWRKTWAR